MPERADVTDDAILNGRLRLHQPRRGHRFGHDAILLAAAVPGREGDHAVEFGAGVGAASLALLSRVGGLRVTLIESEPSLAALAEKNLARNGFADRGVALAFDVGAPARAFSAAGLAAGCADHVFMNPPFNDPSQQPSPDAARRRAHAGDKALLTVWLSAAARLVRPGGTVTAIWRAQALADVLAEFSARFGALSVRPVHGKPDQPAIRVIVQGRSGRRGGLEMLPGLVLNDANNRPGADAEAILREGRALPGGAEAIASPSRRTTRRAGAKRPRSSRAAE
jgi:tRNA1(Val) A37 N6-methylase TrmN6